MSKVLLTLVAVCVVFHQHVRAEDDKCKEDAQKLMKAIGEIIKSGVVPCSQDYKLERFQCNEDESNECSQEEKVREWLSGLKDAELEDAKACIKEVMSKGLEKVEKCKDPNCCEKFKKMLEF